MSYSNVHEKCRGEYYSVTEIVRFQFQDEQTYFEVNFDDYQPTHYNAEILKTAVWADPENCENIKFNKIDNNLDRRSFEGVYQLSKEGKPLNVKGRTGVVGRGLLGKWGPNHAAGPIVTKWKRDKDGNIMIHEITKKPILM